MLDFADAKTTVLEDVPVELDAALGRADWRQRIAWPLSLVEANKIAAEQVSRALDWTYGLGDNLVRDATLLALPNILAYGRAIIFLALAINRASRVRFTGSSPELRYLFTGDGEPPARAAPVLAPVQASLPFLRRVARVKSWTRLSRSPHALLYPAAVAVSHNPLLRAVAAKDTRAIGFCHGDALLGKARAVVAHYPSLEGPASELADALLGHAVLEEPYRQRALALLRAVAAVHLRRAVHDMAGLRALSLPDEVWSGSGGLYAPRAVGLEVLRRSGRVIRFDHGTPRGFMRSSEYTALLELAVSSEFVLATEGAAKICREDTLVGRQYPIGVMRGALGDPTYAAIPAHGARRVRSKRLRVVYAPTQLVGFRQLLPVQPPDVVYLDWQLRVAEALTAMDVELTCQPHPEGLFKGRPHPLEKVARTIRGNFAAQLRSADVFVFDYPSTTALWEVACTDARIVFLDIGAGRLTPPIEKLFRERARVIEVKHDERNRPVLDAEALRDAVLARSSPPDPTPFRRLLAGDA
jgi:hypothetical protein